MDVKIRYYVFITRLLRNIIEKGVKKYEFSFPIPKSLEKDDALDDVFIRLARRLDRHGYSYYMFSANVPHKDYQELVIVLRKK